MGKQLLKIDKFFASSQICNVCGYKNPDTKNYPLDNGNVQIANHITIEM